MKNEMQLARKVRQKRKTSETVNPMFNGVGMLLMEDPKKAELAPDYF